MRILYKGAIGLCHVIIPLEGVQLDSSMHVKSTAAIQGTATQTPCVTLMPALSRRFFAICLHQVLMLVWDDTTNNMGLHAGVMATHDQLTYTYFKDTEVTCVLCPRQGGEEDSLLQVCLVQLV